MIKRLFKIVTKIVVAALLIYTYNVVASPIDATIPINLYTVGAVTFLGIPAIFFTVMLIKFVF